MTSAQGKYRVSFAKEAPGNSFDWSHPNAMEPKPRARLTWTESGFGISGLSAAKIDSLLLAILDDLAEPNAYEDRWARTDADERYAVGRRMGHGETPTSDSRNGRCAAVEPKISFGMADRDEAPLRPDPVLSATS
jgi:hypothetical protein